MLEYPGLAAAVASIRERFHSQLDLAADFYEFWMRWPKDEALATSELDDLVIRTLMPLQHQVCRLFKTTIDVTEKGEAFSGMILCRSMLETLFKIQFLCKTDWQVRVRNRTNASGPIPDAWVITAVTEGTPGAEIQ